MYENFLRQSAEIRALGQFFTTRNAVKSMVKISNIKNLGDNAKICDPFCGVGGFLLEAILENESILQRFKPKNGNIDPKIEIVGFDKGEEKDEGRTIILAKANMLIYFSDLISEYHEEEYLRLFSTEVFNKVFRLINNSDLGTLSLRNETKCDLILTNPPYITSGSGSIKKTNEYQDLDDYYSVGGRGVEALSIEWIVNNLKDGGEFLVVLPDGLLNQKKL